MESKLEICVHREQINTKPTLKRKFISHYKKSIKRTKQYCSKKIFIKKSIFDENQFSIYVARVKKRCKENMMHLSTVVHVMYFKT